MIYPDFSSSTSTIVVKPTIPEWLLSNIKNMPNSPHHISPDAPHFFKQIPQNVDLTEVIDILFNKAPRHFISDYLDILLDIHPNFKLSPLHQLHRSIASDLKNNAPIKITNSSLQELLQQYSLNADEKEALLTSCYDLAYKYNHPCIFRETSTPLDSQKYSLNFLWVNLNPQDRVANISKNIFGDGLNNFENAESIHNPELLQELNEHDLEEIKKTFTYKISKWANLQPNTVINVWFDSALVTQQALDNTSLMMQRISISRRTSIQLRDLRSLPLIQNKLQKAFHPGVPIYYRVDLLKALITDSLLSASEKQRYCVISDIDVEPMNSAQIFDARTLENLSLHGYAFNSIFFNLTDCFENNFLIFDKEKENLQRNHQEHLIQKAFLDLSNASLIRFKGSQNTLVSQSIYKLYKKFREQCGQNEIEFPSKKCVLTPISQFVGKIGSVNNNNIINEEFCFGNGPIPYTRYGRNFKNFYTNEFSPIAFLKYWRPSPLPSSSSFYLKNFQFLSSLNIMHYLSIYFFSLLDRVTIFTQKLLGF